MALVQKLILKWLKKRKRVSEMEEVVVKTEEVAKPINPGDVMYAKKEEAAPIAVDKKVTEVTADKVQDKTADTKIQEQSDKSKEAISIELKLPEGSHLTQVAVDEIASFAKEQGLSQEAATKLLEREHGAVETFKETQLQIFEHKREEWFKEVQSDKELGGDNFKQVAENAKRALNKFAPDSLKTFLAESPYGNHPDLVRLLNNIGKAMQDDKIVLAGTQSPPSASPVDILYDNAKEK